VGQRDCFKKCQVSPPGPWNAPQKGYITAWISTTSASSQKRLFRRTSNSDLFTTDDWSLQRSRRIQSCGCPLIAPHAWIAWRLAVPMSAYQIPACGEGSAPKRSLVKQKRQQVSVACSFCQMRKCKVSLSFLGYHTPSDSMLAYWLLQNACSATGKNHHAQLAYGRASNACTRPTATWGGSIIWGERTQPWQRNAMA